jgi:hypothetical protein
LDGWISMSQILVLIYQGLYNHSFIIRSSWIHINEKSIECGSQSRSWINIKTKTKQKNTHKLKKDEKKRQKQKQNKHNYTHCEFPGYSICGINLLWLFSTDATHTCDIILNTVTISILIPYSQC